MDAESFVISIITKDLYKDIAADVERWFHTSNFDENNKRPLLRGMKKIPGLFKNELRGNMKLFVGVRAKIWTCWMDDSSETKIAKRTKKSLIKKDLMLKNYKNCLLNNKIILKWQQVFRSDHHNVYTVQINKTALSSNDDKRLQTLDRI